MSVVVGGGISLCEFVFEFICKENLDTPQQQQIGKGNHVYFPPSVWSLCAWKHILAIKFKKMMKVKANSENLESELI